MSLFDKTEKAGKYVAELQIGGKTDWYYRVLEVNKKKKKNGGEYLTLLLMDKTGKIPAKVWENSEDVLKIIPAGPHPSGQRGCHRIQSEKRNSCSTPPPDFKHGPGRERK